MSAGPSPPNQPYIDHSAERILARALSLRAKVASTLKRARELPAACREPPHVPTRQELLDRVIALHRAVAHVRAKGQKLGSEATKLEVLEHAAALQREVTDVLARYERAVATATRQDLLRELAALRKQVATALARLKLIPGMVTA